MLYSLIVQVIPSAWLKIYGDEVGNSAILHGPSGNTWQVGVGRPKWVAFRVGWRTFAADNCLEKGDMLVFTLIGNSEFSVKIFDSRTCLEKECSLTATNTGCYDSRSPVLLGEKRKQKDDESPSELKRICLNENGVHFGNSDQALKSFRNGNGWQQSRSKMSTCSSATRISHGECALLDLNSKPLFIQRNPTCDSGKSFPEVNHQLVDAVDTLTFQEYPSGIVYQPHPISIRSHAVEDEYNPQGHFKAQVNERIHAFLSDFTVTIYTLFKLWFSFVKYVQECPHNICSMMAMQIDQLIHWRVYFWCIMDHVMTKNGFIFIFSLVLLVNQNTFAWSLCFLNFYLSMYKTFHF